jgi:pyruvate dehydrogenase E1 component beta subunit
MTGGPFPAAILRPKGEPDLTVVAFGRMSVLAEQAAKRLAEDEEIEIDLVFPVQVSPFEAKAVLDSVASTGKLLVVEEGASGFDLASEVIAAVSTANRQQSSPHCRRLAAQPRPIPSATELEKQVLPEIDDIVAACLELFDA